MLLSQIQKSLNEIAPLHDAEPWDNVGLLAGDPQQTISNILLTIDYTPAVAAEACELHCDLIIAYHPPIFSAVKRITAEGSTALIHDAIRRGIAIYSPHTAWDAATGGTHDFLAEILGLIHVEPLKINDPKPSMLKLVTFVPQSHVDLVSNALFAEGAGHIGHYSSCSFQSPGTGTFFGLPGTHPAIGQPGQLEKQPDIRLETIIPLDKTQRIVRALLATHPYEEPAYDLAMVAVPPISNGQGRVGNLPRPIQMELLVEKIKTALGINAVLLAASGRTLIERVAICAGAGGELLNDAIVKKADLYLTGELRHHDALKATQASMNVICTLHTNCERPSLTRLKARLEKSLANCPPIVLSQQDRDPFVVG